ncbi:hypothetical protein RJT34_03374 [Clitoria ternatea]|uniref:Uncharacterized protein n=1 Tax=Clitoria ternatea TaxID=43366 RepID=A0AAN9KMV4_CLITE
MMGLPMEWFENLCLRSNKDSLSSLRPAVGIVYKALKSTYNDSFIEFLVVKLSIRKTPTPSIIKSKLIGRIDQMKKNLKAFKKDEGIMDTSSLVVFPNVRLPHNTAPNAQEHALDADDQNIQKEEATDRAHVSESFAL